MNTISTADVESLRARCELPDQTIVLYAGRFGRANAIPALIDAANRLANRDDVCFVFTGQGYHAPVLHRAARHNPTLRLLPPQPRRRTLTLFRLADLSLVPFIDRPVLATNSPSKLYDSLAAGTPVIVTNPGWTKTLVEQHGCGWYVPADRPGLLAKRIAALLETPARYSAAGARAAALAQRRFDRSVHMQRLRSIIESVGSAPRPSAPEVC
jgi:glycosyltransferase involved in cell wall biosynthesis